MAALASTTKSMKGVFPRMRKVCDHCGKPLKEIEVNLFGKMVKVTCWESCGCSESKLDGMYITDKQKEYVRAGIPERYLGADSCDDKHLSVIAGNSLYIQGDNGNGKTRYACGIARKLVDAGTSVYFINSKHLISEIQGTYSGRPTDALDRAYTCKVLVLDDLGKEQPTAYSLSMLYELIDSRYSAMKPIVVTSNFSRGGLVERWASADLPTAEAIASRLCEGVETVVFEGGDRRLA